MNAKLNEQQKQSVITLSALIALKHGRTVIQRGDYEIAVGTVLTVTAFIEKDGL